MTGWPGHVSRVLLGLREPIVVILLLIALFTSISGKPLDGLLMLLVAVTLAWDSGRQPRHRRRAPGSPGQVASPAGAPAGPAGPGGAAGGVPPAPRAHRQLLTVTWLAIGALYVLAVGSFSRYSWPATVAVVSAGTMVVVTGWQGPRHPRPAQPRPPARGLLMWAAVLVAGGLWELASLFQQPALTTSSYAHPTISTLTDPVLATWAGRSVVLAGWLGLGRYLSGR